MEDIRLETEIQNMYNSLSDSDKQVFHQIGGMSYGQLCSYVYARQMQYEFKQLALDPHTKANLVGGIEISLGLIKESEYRTRITKDEGFSLLDLSLSNRKQQLANIKRNKLNNLINRLVLSGELSQRWLQ